ncbi:hypothetical protein S245_007072 [Arachis hypogaea]
MSLESDSSEFDIPIELGCSCKDDLAAAHKVCAKTWFKIKGNVLRFCPLQVLNMSIPLIFSAFNPELLKDFSTARPPYTDLIIYSLGCSSPT